MNGEQFVRRVRKWARQREFEVTLVKSRGKGGHRMLVVGDRKTFVKTGEIGKGLEQAMLEQLDIPPEEW